MNHRTLQKNIRTAMAISALVVMGVCILIKASLWQGLFILINLLVFFLYGLDKYRAVHDSRNRISEQVLLGFAILGGVPGSVLGQVTFHHKIRKQPFRRIFWGIAIIQVTVLSYLYLKG